MPKVISGEIVKSSGCTCPCNSCNKNGNGPWAGTHVGPGVLDRYYDEHQVKCDRS